MAVGDAYVFPGFLTPVLTQLVFPKPPTTFLTCFCRGERRKYTGKKSRFNRGPNSQPPGHDSNTLTTEPPRRGLSLEKTEWAYCCLSSKDSLIIHYLYSKDGFTYGQSIQYKMLLVRLHVYRSINPLHHMAILGSTNSVANRDMM